MWEEVLGSELFIRDRLRLSSCVVLYILGSVPLATRHYTLIAGSIVAVKDNGIGKCHPLGFPVFATLTVSGCLGFDKAKTIFPWLKQSDLASRALPIRPFFLSEPEFPKRSIYWHILSPRF